MKRFRKEFATLCAIPEEIQSLKQQINKISNEKHGQLSIRSQYGDENLPPAQPLPIRFKDAIESEI